MNPPRCSHQETPLFGHVLRHVLPHAFSASCSFTGLFKSGAGEGNTERWEAQCSLCFSTARKGAAVGRRRGNRTDSPFSATINNPKDTVV
jgi:hypothetical protein